LPRIAGNTTTRKLSRSRSLGKTGTGTTGKHRMAASKGASGTWNFTTRTKSAREQPATRHDVQALTSDYVNAMALGDRLISDGMGRDLSGSQSLASSTRREDIEAEAVVTDYRGIQEEV
ncbi:unnamed protein product, partial [Chrysoparadoxa australica]